MNQAIANIVRTHIEGLDFVDKIAGLVSTVYMDVTDKDNKLVQKTFPVACCVTADDCKQGAYNDLMPNSQYKTVIYFEDMGITFNKYESNWKYYTSKVRLVCWINVAKILGDNCNTGTACTLAAHLITEIIRVLPAFPEHHYPFNHVYSEVVNQEIRDNSIFGKYTFDEKHIQYLMYPYDYFALDIETHFAVCMENTVVYDSECNILTDYDGNIYTYIIIGTQQWIIQNLKVTHYADGTIIPNLTLAANWTPDTTGAYCVYNNDITNKTIYGVLYNWYAVNNAHVLPYFKRNGIFEAGWRVPDETDWNTLMAYLGGTTVAGGKMKEIGLTYWNTPNTGATNISGFTGLGTGWRINTGVFSDLNKLTYMWASNEHDATQTHTYNLHNNSEVFSINSFLKNNGMAVRCMRDLP